MQQPRTNQKISAHELRVLGNNGENLGILTLEEALKEAEKVELDLVEISPNANPPVAKITDLGKYLYEEKKKGKMVKKSHYPEVKNVQVKLGTGEHDLSLKARRVTEWISDGHKVKLDLFLPGRAKYLDENFLKERIERVLRLVSVDYKVAEPAKKSPKGMTVIIEKV